MTQPLTKPSLEKLPCPQKQALKFSDPDVTIKGDPRAIVPFIKMKTFWVNTGTLCNIACQNCYIESGPKNDVLSYLTAFDLHPFLEELSAPPFTASAEPKPEIGFTGGEPFMNPDMLHMMEDCLKRGFNILILTNAMQPMQRPKIKQGLLALKENYNDRMSFRVSLDHYTQQLHDAERGAKSWDNALIGLDWLSENGFNLMLAGRTIFGEDQDKAKQGYSDLVAEQNWPVNVNDKASLMLFPEMKTKQDIPEISVNCWSLLNVQPSDQMCATSRMLIKRKGVEKANLVPCTLITKDPLFDMGYSLKQAMAQDQGMFKDGGVKLCHPFCAEFCVLGGGSCSVD